VSVLEKPWDELSREERIKALREGLEKAIEDGENLPLDGFAIFLFWDKDKETERVTGRVFGRLDRVFIARYVLEAEEE